MMSFYINDIATLDFHVVDCRFIIYGISKSETINSLRKADFNEKSKSWEGVRT